MDYQDKAKKLLAVEELLSGETTTKEKLNAIGQLIKGVNPSLEKKYNACLKAINSLDEIKSTDVIDLAADVLPEDTPEKKKRKKLLLLFIQSFKELQNEIKRVRREMERNQGNEGNKVNRGNMVGKMGSLGRIFAFAKGPLGIVTLIAAGIVALKITAVTITIKNQGCPVMAVRNIVPFSLPGLELPRKPIATGEVGTAKLIPLRFTVDATNKNLVKLQGFGLHFKFELTADVADFVFDGESLMGRQTDINLRSRPDHELTVFCR